MLYLYIFLYKCVYNIYLPLYNKNKYRKRGHGFVREEGMGEVEKRMRENVNRVHIEEI